jgi:hypothetical protein
VGLIRRKQNDWEVLGVKGRIEEIKEFLDKRRECGVDRIAILKELNEWQRGERRRIRMLLKPLEFVHNDKPEVRTGPESYARIRLRRGTVRCDFA